MSREQVPFFMSNTIAETMTRTKPAPQAYRGLTSEQAQTLAQILCLAAARTGCFRHLPAHLIALKLVDQADLPVPS